jgi:hypothetical protein
MVVGVTVELVIIQGQRGVIVEVRSQVAEVNNSREELSNQAVTYFCNLTSYF